MAKIPADLDRAARSKWRELILCVDPEEDLECLGNYCRLHSSLLALRAEKAKQMKAGKFKMMVSGRDKSKQLNPMLREENRMVAALGKMLQTLGLTPTRDDGKKRKTFSEPRPKWAPPDEPEPACGWAIESVMEGYRRWNERTHDYEDVPEGIPEHPGHPDHRLYTRGCFLASEMGIRLADKSFKRIEIEEMPCR
jgi:phage terminase small subunit